MRSEGHTKHHEIARHVLFSVVIRLSLQVQNREYLISGAAYDSGYQEVLALCITTCYPLNCCFSFSQSWQTMSLNKIFQSIRITLVSTKTLSSMLIFFLPFYSVTYQQSEVYLSIRHKPGRAGSSDAGSQFHCRETFCKGDPG